MYSTCIFCHAALEANDTIEHFPIGRRLAFDSERGRLWVVCRRCRQWNLTPVEERWEDNGTLLGVMLRAGRSQVGLSQDDWQKGRERKKGVGMRLFMSTTQNVDEIAARAKAAGVRLDSEPHDTEWKSRAFEVTDPSGFLMTISSDIPA